MSGNIHQSDKDKLKATIAGALDSSNPELDDDSIAGGETRETPIALSYAWDLELSRWVRLKVAPSVFDNALFVLVRGNLGTFTVTQAAKDRTVTGTATVTPSGDMARKAYYDRNPTAIMNYYTATLAAHGVTTRSTYTVPSGRSAQHSVIMGILLTAINAAAGQITILHVNDIASAGLQTYGRLDNFFGAGSSQGQTITAAYFIAEDDVIYIQTYSSDDVNHSYRAANLLTEFDV